MPRAQAAAPPSLERYRAKRDFTRTPEPADVAEAARADALGFVVQKHDARRLHYDFRLEWGGVLWSWAVPKGPSLDPAVKRMAVRTEDHPLAYAGFEGRIPEGEYGAGDVIVWDRGSWVPEGDPEAGLAKGKLGFTLFGHKLAGRWELVKLRGAQKQESWLLLKRRDEAARPEAEFDVVKDAPDSVAARPAPPAPAAAEPTPPAARAAPLPEALSPQLALLATAVPGQGHWIFETKFDGYRLLARLEGGRARLITRNGHDWTERMPELAAELHALAATVGSAWLDGEIVVPKAEGEGDGTGGDFNALQNAFDRRRTASIRYRLFDLPHFDGHDLRDAPLASRRELLRQWLAAQPQPRLAFSEALGEGGATAARRVLAAACEAGLEGIIAKRDDAPYRAARDGRWLKLKCHARQEFVVGGYTLRSDDAQAVGSLLLGVHDEAGALRHAGSVGTGWDRATAQALRRKLKALETATPPFTEGPRAPGRWSRRTGGEQWVKPRLVVEVAFAGWTPAGHVRHASFVGERGDKPAREIRREDAAPAAAPAAAGDTAAPAVKVTHPTRVVDAASGATKLDLVRFYERIAPFLLPHLAGRPVALLRAPGGVGGPTFFQKHNERTRLPGVRELDPALWPGHDALLEIATPEALLAAAQMNVVEFHPWNTRTRHMAKPDRMVFDLDPGEGVPFAAVREGTQLVRTLLQELGLESWLKTSGGKGLHVVVPIAPRWPFDTVKAFSQQVVQHLARTIPQRFVAKSGPKNRVGRIFVDYLRNGEGATTVAPFSARARPGLGVSMPLAWDALPQLKSAAEWTVENARDHLSLRGADPWAGLDATKQSLAAPMKALAKVAR